MAEVGFYIDTEAQEEGEEDKNEILVKEDNKILGALDAAQEKKLRDRAKTERSLASFLFGQNIQENTDKGKAEQEEDSDEDEGIPSDLEDEDVELSDNEIKSNDEEGENEESDGSDEDVEPTSAQPTLPVDIFGGALNMASGKRKRKAAWVDKDDAGVLVKDVVSTYSKAVGKHGTKEVSEEQYGKTLSRKFKSVVGEPAWAALGQDDDEDSDDEFFRETTDLMEKKGKMENLEKGKLQYRKLKDLNYTTHKEGAVIRATEFHPTSTVAMVAGNNGTVSLFQVDGKENPKLQTINFQNFPIRTGKFSANGNEFIVGSQHHPHYYIYDMMAGKSIKVPWKAQTGEHNSAKFEVSPDGKCIAFRGRFGFIHIISAKTKELLQSLKMNHDCGDLKFSGQGSQLYSTGTGGEVYIWDLRTYTALHKFTDDGCLSGTALSLSSQYLAAGSSSGVVNIYSVSGLSKTNTSSPKPDKILMNLTTEIESLSFHPSGEMLAMASTAKEGAIKMVHFPSMSVFPDFPGNTNLSRVNCQAFSPGGGYFAVGNNKGRGILYRLGHYTSY